MGKSTKESKEKKRKGDILDVFMQTKGGREETTGCLGQEGKQMIKELEANANTEICQSER